MQTNLGRTPKNKPPFPRLFEKKLVSKNTFFPWFLKKGPKSPIFRVPAVEIFFNKLSIIKLRHTKTFGRDPPQRHFRAYFKKMLLRLLFQINQISAFLDKLQNMSGKNLKTPIRKKGRKSRWLRKSPTEISGDSTPFRGVYFENIISKLKKNVLKVEFSSAKSVSQFFYQKFVKKISTSGTLKIGDFGPFFKNQWPKFLPTRKKRVFWNLVFFEKSRKSGCIFAHFWEVRPKLVFTKTYQCNLSGEENIILGSSTKIFLGTVWVETKNFLTIKTLRVFFLCMAGDYMTEHLKVVTREPLLPWLVFGRLDF